MVVFVGCWVAGVLVIWQVFVCGLQGPQWWLDFEVMNACFLLRWCWSPTTTLCKLPHHISLSLPPSCTITQSNTHVGAYAAYDLQWQMEELLMERPDLDKLATCVALLRVSERRVREGVMQ